MTCPEIDLGEFGERLRASQGGRRVPLSGHIELTARCNLNCLHCYVNQPASSVLERSQELAHTQWCDILDQITAEGCLTLLLTGGEPLLRPDFVDIYDYAKRKGLVITLFTNGTLITAELADHLREWPPHMVEITLYGATAETYERVTGIPGSFQRCMGGVHLLVERSVPLRLKTVVMRPNRHEFEAMEAFAARLGLEFRYDAVIRPRPDGMKDLAAIRLSPQEVVALDFTHPDVLEDWRKKAEDHVAGDLSDGPLYVCGAGLHTFHIDAHGCLSLCIATPEPCYSIPDGTFQEGWCEFLGNLRRTPCVKDYECRHCNLAEICGFCPSFAFYETGQAEAAVEYLCEIAKLRARAGGLSVSQS